jgi:hypothetical protein
MSFTANPAALKEDPAIREALRRFAAEVTREANRTSARAGYTYRLTEGDDGPMVRIGPTGAAGLPVEIGSRTVSARRHVKRALDAQR